MTDKLTKQLEKMERRYESYKKDFARDGKITRDEAVILESVSAKLINLRKKVVARNQKKGIVDFSDKPLQVKSDGVKSYDYANFYDSFRQSLKDWSQDGGIALNKVKNYFDSDDKPQNLGVKELLTVVSWIVRKNPKAAAIMGTISLIYDSIKAGYEASLPPTPSLNDIQQKWHATLLEFGNKDHKKEYANFVKEFKKNNGISDDIHEAPVNIFQPECSGFAKKYMPDVSRVEKAFLKLVLSHVKDSWDWDNESGYADVELMCLAGHFSLPKGQLDDCSEKLVEAIRQVWKGARVIDLPVPVKFIIRNNMGANLAEMERTSKKPGNAGFKHKKGDRAVFDVFMKKEAYAIPKVSHLKHDS
jgi:hypothetical protein